MNRRPAQNRVDRFAMILFPVMLGSGPVLFPDGLPRSGWTLVSSTSGADGTVALVWDRDR